MIVVPRPRKRWNCRWLNCPKLAQPRKRSFCTLYYQHYLRGQDNNAAKSLASICNNSGNNEPRDVSAIGNVGGDHAINNNNRDVAFVNNIGDTEIIHDKCGTGPDVHIDNQSGVGDFVMTMAHCHPVETMDLKLDGLIILSRVSLLLLGTLVVVMRSIIITLMWLS